MVVLSDKFGLVALGIKGLSIQEALHPTGRCLVHKKHLDNRHLGPTNAHSHIDMHEYTQTHMDIHTVRQFSEKHDLLGEVRKVLVQAQSPEKAWPLPKKTHKAAIDFIISQCCGSDKQ